MLRPYHKLIDYLGHYNMNYGSTDLEPGWLIGNCRGVGAQQSFLQSQVLVMTRCAPTVGGSLWQIPGSFPDCIEEMLRFALT
jgi:hypothetical protein